MVLWRISHHDSLNGEGGWRAAGRWHSRGRLIVYCAPSPAAALIELLVRLEVSPLEGPVTYRLLRIDASGDLPVPSLDVATLGADWVTDRAATQSAGNEWLTANRSALLSVPSAVIPHTSNLLFNPVHPDSKRVRLADVTEHTLDARLVR